jgi:hypothetical protein
MTDLDKLKKTLKASGDLFLPEKVRRFLYRYIVGSDTSIVYISYWSILHLISGVLTGALIKYYNLGDGHIGYYSLGLFIHTLWELWQKFIGMTIWDLRGAIDTAMDTIMFLIGMWLVAGINTKKI